MEDMEVMQAMEVMEDMGIEEDKKEVLLTILQYCVILNDTINVVMV